MISPPPVINIIIRRCEDEDVASVTRIYGHHVLHLASFEVEPPSEDDMRDRHRNIVGKGLPYLVAEYAG